MPTQTMPRMTGAALPRISQFAKDGRQQLLHHVRADIAELETELKTLRETERALKGGGGGGGGASTRTPTGGNGARTTSRRPARARRARPARKTLTEAMVIGAIRDGHDRSSMIATALGSTTSTIMRRLTELKTKGMVKRTGAGARTRWTLTEKAMR